MDHDIATRRRHHKEKLDRILEPPPFRLRLDPTESALRLSAWRSELPSPICLELGRRLLLAQFESSEWILRRVEKTSFDRDRSVTRENDIDFLVRADAPTLIDHNDEEFWLVPLSRLHRRTMVNFAIRDEDGRAVTRPGLRFTQQLDQSMLLAAAAVVNPDYAREGSDVRKWIEEFVAGEKPVVKQSMSEFEAADEQTRLPKELRDDSLFAELVDRLHRAFTLYLLLPVRCGRKRFITMVFDEPTDWRYQRPQLEAVRSNRDREPDYHYQPNRKPLWYKPVYLQARLGMRYTRVRLQVPAAEAAASYHFEATAPPGVRIVRASLLAGRPNDRSPVSLDRVVGHSPTVGLHAVEIPSGSLCRVQLDLAIPVRGLMTTLFTASWVIFAVLLSVAWHWWGGSPNWASDQIINVVLILVTTSAGAAALVAQQNEAGVAARLVAGARALATVAMGLPVVQACFLVFDGAPGGASGRVHVAAPTVAGVAAGITLIMTVAWFVSLGGERGSKSLSPWDMTDDKLQSLPSSFHDAVQAWDFNSPAVGIRSGEAWHENYRWSDQQQFEAVRRLRSALIREEVAPSAAQYCIAASGACEDHRNCPRIPPQEVSVPDTPPKVGEQSGATPT